MLHHVFRLFGNPILGWRGIREAEPGVTRTFITHTVPCALIPAACGFVGTTVVGWQVGSGETVRLTDASAGRIAASFFLAMLAVTFSVAWMIRWMGQTYGAHQTLARCYALTSFAATPLFLVGAALLYPVLWIDLLLGLPALAYSIYLFFSGVPELMEIPEERAFLFACAVMAFGLVALVALLAITVLLWSSGLEPTFAAP